MALLAALPGAGPWWRVVPGCAACTTDVGHAATRSAAAADQLFIAV